MAYTFVDSRECLVDFLGKIIHLPTNPPSLYIDLEGVHLSRTGPIAILQIYVLPMKHSYLIDVFKLQEFAFITPGGHGTTLKHVLEDQETPKVFFDVRNDSAALFAQYRIDLKGVHDLQVMEFARRPGRRGKFVSGLAKSIEKDANLGYLDRKRFLDTKEAGKNLFAPEKGGSYEVFLARPISPEILNYCVQDVHYLPRLWKIYSNRLQSPSLKTKVQQEVTDRIWLSQQQDFETKGRNMAIGPWQPDSISVEWFMKQSRRRVVPASSTTAATSFETGIPGKQAVTAMSSSSSDITATTSRDLTGSLRKQGSNNKSPTIALSHEISNLASSMQDIKLTNCQSSASTTIISKDKSVDS